MEKQTPQYHHHPQQQQQVVQQTLKCPRCDSSNTKFCYYNNYSLSQPRHFCKACKRYWTRGGTLRNVPVGGGCRKNKKVKKHSISDVDSPSSSLPTTTTNPNLNPPLFYGVPTNPSYYSFNNFKVMNVDEVSGYDLHTQMNTVHELGFASSSSALSSYPFFGSLTSNSMASLIGSSLEQQQKYVSVNNFSGQAPHDEHDMKTKDTQNKMDWVNIVPNGLQNQIQHIGSSSDSSLLWMLDPANIGSSVPSLI